MAFNPYWVRFEMVRMPDFPDALFTEYCKAGELDTGATIFINSIDK
jgi:hypothetical protein